jgi:hypothetical protein
MRIHIIILAVIVAVTLTPGFAMSQQTSPYETDICPIPAGVRGYTIVVRPEAGTNADTTYLKEIANQAGGFFTGTPTEPQKAAVLAVVDRDGRLRRASLVQRSGNNRLDRGALSSIRQAFEHSTYLSPSGFTADSLVVRILFGEEPREGEITFRRFSAQHRLPEFSAPRGRMVWPADLPAPRVGGLAIAWIEFNEDGTASLSDRNDPIQASDSRLIALARAIAPRLRFVPGQSNCEPQAYELPVRMDFSERTHVRLEIVGP